MGPGQWAPALGPGAAGPKGPWPLPPQVRALGLGPWAHMGLGPHGPVYIYIYIYTYISICVYVYTSYVKWICVYPFLSLSIYIHTITRCVLICLVLLILDTTNGLHLTRTHFGSSSLCSVHRFCLLYVTIPKQQCLDQCPHSQTPPPLLRMGAGGNG